MGTLTLSPRHTSVHDKELVSLALSLSFFTTPPHAPPNGTRVHSRLYRPPVNTQKESMHFSTTTTLVLSALSLASFASAGHSKHEHRAVIARRSAAANPHAAVARRSASANYDWSSMSPADARSGTRPLPTSTRTTLASLPPPPAAAATTTGSATMTPPPTIAAQTRRTRPPHLRPPLRPAPRPTVATPTLGTSSRRRARHFPRLQASPPRRPATTMAATEAGLPRRQPRHRLLPRRPRPASATAAPTLAVRPSSTKTATLATVATTTTTRPRSSRSRQACTATALTAATRCASRARATARLSRLSFRTRARLASPPKVLTSAGARSARSPLRPRAWSTSPGRSARRLLSLTRCSASAPLGPFLGGRTSPLL